ncbi:MAG: DUF4834 family protein [Bacteroides sp.]|nr:DUF4834 family protein [Bacteroides sp.]
MFHILGFIFIIIIAILIIGLSIIGTVIRSVFRMGGRRQNNDSYQGNGWNGQSRQGYSFNSGQQSSKSASNEGVTPEEGELHINRKKIFTKDEGEYVDFEEIKE